MPSSEAVTALTEQPPSARCLTVQNCGPRSSKTTPSTVPITIVFERASLRCEFDPPLESRIIVQSFVLILWVPCCPLTLPQSMLGTITSRAKGIFNATHEGRRAYYRIPHCERYSLCVRHLRP